jgi:hypothetical protein
MMSNKVNNLLHNYRKRQIPYLMSKQFFFGGINIFRQSNTLPPSASIVDRDDFVTTRTTQQRSPIKLHGSHPELAFSLTNCEE